jgi:DNA-binding NtrC family response regulator/tetratricopeptide (TPR) repeat protein
MRRGRFSEAVDALQPSAQQPHGHLNPHAESLLADALQRLGKNERAESIALRSLQITSLASELKARYHFVLGNIYRDRGETAKATEELQRAIALAGDNVELLCWAQLRLLAAIAELAGPDTAMARLDEVKRALTRFGDARPFAALHQWLAQFETARNNLDEARRHLKAADLLLGSVDDVYVRGSHAVSCSVVHYFCAEIVEACRWAEAAILYSQQSGNRSTIRAAHANLGYISFSLGQFERAENLFQVALDCCEGGSAEEILILDNIAQVKLRSGDLDGCRSTLQRLERLADQNHDVKRRHYKSWALQTKVRLFLNEGKTLDAKELSQRLQALIVECRNTRVMTESHLVCSEALLANNEIQAAANELAALFSVNARLSPDLFAEMERIAGKTLAASGAELLARVRIHRSLRTYDIVGHSLGKKQSVADLALVRDVSTLGGDEGRGVQVALDRIRALLDTRHRADLFAHEAKSLLEDLKCACSIDLCADDGSAKRRDVRRSDGKGLKSSPCETSITIGSSQRNVTLSYVTRQDPISKLNSLGFERVIKEILSLPATKSDSTAQEIVWTRKEETSDSAVVFACDAMRSVLRVAKQIAPTDVSVLLTGETGTGKEVIARTLHEWSLRSTMPFLAINCAAVPRELLESQLFGHRKGAFSGANDHFPGLVRAANGGTLLLDEIGEMPLDMQAKLLRFLELGEVHPIGETQPVKVNVRLIFATNGDLEEAVSQNRFRQDLFYRINVVPMRIPPLRERREEIPVLAKLFAQRSAKEFAKQPLEFSTSAMELLILHSWPGNVRQLANEIRRLAALLESGACIMPEHLSAQLRPKPHNGTSPIQAVPELAVRIDQPLDQAVARLESEMIQRALRESNGHLSAAASTLGISRKGLYLKRMRLGLIGPVH